MTSFRFSPIENESKLREVVRYIATKSSQLCEEVIGATMPIKSLTVFSHYSDEYEKLSKILLEMGTLVNENNGPRAVLHQPIDVSGHRITHLRIRKPDPERPQVGCNDFEVEDYSTFKSKHLSQHTNNLRLIVRSEYEMIEFFDSNYDVLAYVVSH